MANTSGVPPTDDLSLSACYQYDQHPERAGQYLRFMCPIHYGDNQKSFSVHKETGKFTCHNCGAWGTVTEKQDRRESASTITRGRRARTRPMPPLNQAEKLERKDFAFERARLACSQYEGSPAHAYARKRGVPDDLARRLKLGYWKGVWKEEDSEWLTFPVRCPVTGEIVGVSGRNIQCDDQKRKARTLGPRGLFGAFEKGPLPKDVILVEGPFEVIACLVTPDLPPARACVGSCGQAAWFDDCDRVTILFDDDETNWKGEKPGEKSAARMVKEFGERRVRRGRGPRVLTLKPGELRERLGCKDLGDLLQRGERVPLALPPLVTPPSPAPLPLTPDELPDTYSDSDDTGDPFAPDERDTVLAEGTRLGFPSLVWPTDDGGAQGWAPGERAWRNRLRLADGAEIQNALAALRL